MVEFILRPAEKEEFSAIRALIHKVRINPTGLHWERFLVAIERNGRLIGCGQVKIHADGSRELASLAVEREFRSQGVARAIIEKLIRQEPARPLYLMCRSRLEPLYSKFGFRTATAGSLPRYFQRIRRLERLFNAGTGPEDRLSIMQLD